MADKKLDNRRSTERMTQRKRKQRKMSTAIITTSLLCIVVSVIIAVFAIVYFTFHLVLEEKGESRVDVLKQISDSNSINRMNMVNVMNMVYDDFYSVLTAQASEQTNARIAQQLEQTDALLQHIGMDYTIDIVMNDHREFTTDEDKNNIESLQSTYWYIRHYSGETDTSWNLRFWDVDDISTYGLSYGRTIYTADENPIGVIVITTEHEALFRTFQELVRDGARVYILDQNGIIICHTSAQRVGNWMTSMDAFQKEYGYNSYQFTYKNGENIILANYRDSDSGWVFVEEQNINSLLLDSVKIIRNCMMIVLLGCVLAAMLAYVRGKQVTNVLVDFTDQISNMPADRLSDIQVNEKYEEIHVLGTAFNGMLHRLRELVEDIRLREQEKQRTEYDFLQAQVNPHFLNNTLLAVKSLIALGNVDRASRMMNQLVELLHIPSTPEIQFVTLAEEIHLVENYISIMNCRTEKGVAFLCNLPEDILTIPVPRMILQPIVDNSFFHGFAERDEGCWIRLKAGFRGNTFYIEVIDNGEGITKARLAEIASGNYQSKQQHHGIGLRNVQDRLKIIYGGNSGVRVKSERNGFTSVTITMDHYRELRKMIKKRLNAAKEAEHENYGRR